MSAVDVLAYLDALIATHKALSSDAFHVQELPKAEAARAAVAELIEAAINVHAACRAGKEPDLIALADALDGVGAKHARRAALASAGAAS